MQLKLYSNHVDQQTSDAIIGTTVALGIALKPTNKG
jgi:hypothetical protein